MVREIEVEIAELTKTMPINYQFSTKWFKKVLSEKYNRSNGSYIPSDYCYNRSNKGIIHEKQPHYFLWLSRGKYQYVGKDYVYNGEVERNQKNKT